MLGWLSLAAIVALGVAVWQMPAATKAAIWSGVWRTTFWVALAAVLPWVAQFFIRRVASAGTNWAGVALLAGLSVVNVLSGVLLMTAWPGGGWAWFGAISGLVVAGLYNFLVVEYLADMAGG